ncbi:hypothetical protein [Chitinophaga sp. MM2321]|uniref:hypothetical protein n=1 Tax=Chitinophaga sp. MM2321 TaxID=3137178 RepID=UPI0032D5AE92
MKKSTFIQIALTSIPIILVLLGFWAGGMFKMINTGYALVVLVIVLVVIFLVVLLCRKIAQSRTITNGMPATAMVIQCDKGSIIMITGGVDKSYILKMEVNVTNNNGETWAAKMVEDIPAAQADMFRAGYKFSVLYDPDNRKKIVFDKSQHSWAQ